MADNLVVCQVDSDSSRSNQTKKPFKYDLIDSVTQFIQYLGIARGSTLRPNIPLL